MCDGCGKCCLHKAEDEETGIIYPTNVALPIARPAQLPVQQLRRAPRDSCPDCVRLTARNVDKIDWLPSTCAYRLRAAGEPLREWHYLISGDRETVHKRRHFRARLDDQRDRRR